MTSRAVEVEIVGREEERAAVDAFLGAADALPAALVIEGEAGIGKTTLWRAGIVAAEERGYCVLSARPVETESQISYVGLADLLEPVLDETLATLPSPQRHALEVALLLRDPGATAPDQGTIAFALLSALRAAATEGPVLVAVDDLQWLDAPSAFAVRFAARRLTDDPVGFLLALRVERDTEAALERDRLLSSERLHRVQVGPLSLGALHHLVRDRLDLVLPRPTLRRLHETSGGNPFVALELARALKERGRPLEPGEPLPVSGLLRQLVSARIAALSESSTDALLFAAAASQPTVQVVAEAAADDVRPSLNRGVQAGVIELEGDRIRFVHPLFASVAYSEADPARRRALHRRLAAIVTEPEERARHLALCTEAPDPAVAAALDEAAGLALGRGAPQAAAELGEQALRLTPPEDAEALHRRRLGTGAAYFAAGDTARAVALFEAAAAAGGSKRAEALTRLAQVHHYVGDQHVAVAIFRESLADERLDTSARAEASDGLANSLFFLREDLDDALRHARAAARVAERHGDLARVAVALGTQALVEAVLGLPKAAVTLDSALAVEKRARDPRLVLRSPTFHSGVVRVWADELEGAREVLEDVRARAVAQGHESSLPFILSYLALAEFLAGRWNEAARAARAGEEVAFAGGQVTGRAFALSTRALVAACVGRDDEARADAEEALALAERGAMFAAMTSRWALGLLDLSLGNPGDAARQLGALVDSVQAAGIGEPGSIRFVWDEIEALVACRDHVRAVERLGWLETRARRLERRSALAAARRCRGLLALAAGRADEAVEEIAKALDELEALPLPFERARTLLALGTAQRLARRRSAARETLEGSLRAFEALGAALWATRARAEIGRISGRAPSGADLTPTERRVAELVAAGRTNREVAAELFVTPRTVEGTLSRVYAKLGLRSRTELAHHWASRRT